MNKTDKNWLKLFKKYDILKQIRTNTVFRISSKQINEFRESRLMTKFDHEGSLPEIFKVHFLSILPVSRGDYLIGPFQNYQKVHYDPTLVPTLIQKPEYIETLDIQNIYSESAALNTALVCGILEDLAEDRIAPTISGRMSSSNFKFWIKNNYHKDDPISVSVQNSQCEIDGGYESPEKLFLIEAKNFRVDDFLIRQIYYPYRLWQSKIKKEVVPVFMTYSNDTFDFFIYKYRKINEYNSLELIAQKKYILNQERISFEDIRDLLERVSIQEEPEVPFPQADKFDRIVDLLHLLNSKRKLEDIFISENYNFVSRQAHYYKNAAEYLGLCHQKDGQLELTKTAKTIMDFPYKKKYFALAECILSHRVFNEALKLYFKKLGPVSNAEVVSIMKVHPIFKVKSEATYKRRAQTVISWIEWILDLQNEDA